MEKPGLASILGPLVLPMGRIYMDSCDNTPCVSTTAAPAGYLQWKGRGWLYA